MAIFDPANMPTMTDDQLKKELVTCEPGSRVYILISDELNRRYLGRAGDAAHQLSSSSGRVEKLTWVLIVLTIVLIVLAAPPAWDALTKLFSK